MQKKRKKKQQKGKKRKRPKKGFFRMEKYKLIKKLKFIFISLDGNPITKDSLLCPFSNSLSLAWTCNSCRTAPPSSPSHSTTPFKLLPPSRFCCMNSMSFSKQTAVSTILTSSINATNSCTCSKSFNLTTM